MNFLRTAFWVIVAVALALFTKANWSSTPDYAGYIPVKLWGDMILEARLPVLILAAFLLGLIPTWLWSRALQWRLQRKLTQTEKALSNSITAASAAFPSTGVTTDADIIAAPTPDLTDETTYVPSSTVTGTSSTPPHS